MTLIFIRHNEKSYKNGKGIPEFDPGIECQKTAIKTLVDQVYTSPYRRCFYTAKLYSDEPKIINELSEYLGWWENISYKHFCEETFKHIIIEKNIPDFKKRINLFYNSLNFKTDKKELYVTHGFVLDILYHLFRKEFKNIELIGKNPKEGFLIYLR